MVTIVKLAYNTRSQQVEAEFSMVQPQKITPALKVRAEAAPTFNPSGAAHAVMPFALWLHYASRQLLCLFSIASFSYSASSLPSIGKAKNPLAALVVLACAVIRAAGLSCLLQSCIFSPSGRLKRGAKATPTLVQSVPADLII